MTRYQWKGLPVLVLLLVCLYLLMGGSQGLGQRPSPDREVLALAVSPDGQELYVGTAGDGLWISHDAGMTWASVPQMADDYVSAGFDWSDAEGGKDA